jgi:two-component system cell cycle sensor histidine kinase/response regulator CckA
MVLLVSLAVLAVPLMSILIPDDARRANFVFVALALAACIGVAALFAVAAGWLRLSMSGVRNDATKALADAHPDALLVRDADGRTLYANPSYLRLSGARDGRDVRSLDRLVSGGPEVSEAIYRLAAAARQGREASEDVILSPPLAGDAPEGHYRIRTTPLDLDGGAHAFTLLDLTRDRDRQTNIYQDLQRQIDYLDHAPVGFLYSQPDGAISYLNATLAGWLGHDIAELKPGRVHLRDVVAGPSLAYLEAVVGRRGEVRTETLDLEMKRADGRSLPVRLIHSVPFGADGSRGAARTIVLDRAAAGEGADAPAGAGGDARFSKFFDNTPLAIASVDGGGRILRHNGLFARIKGEAGAAEAGGERTIGDVIADEFRERLSAALALAAGGQLDIPAFDVTSQSGRALRIFITAVDRRDDDATAAIVYLLDVSEEKKLQEQFTQSSKMNAIGQLAGGVAHDFNNLLQAILGFSELLLAKHTIMDQEHENLVQIKTNTLRASQLVNQLLAYSRRQTLTPTVLSIGDLISELQALLRRTIGANVDLDVVHGRDLWPVKADGAQMHSVIINLAVNARDAMAPNGGKLFIRTRNMPEAEARTLTYEGFQPADFVLIEVEDTGAGIPKEIIDRIFDPFFTTKDVGKGTGLGLSTVYGIIKQTNGFIYVDSKVGVGTTFRILLPRHVEGEAVDTHALAKPAQPEEDVSGEGVVLLVEDEQSVRHFVSMGLQMRGYRVVVAESGVEALDLVKSQGLKFDLVVSDVMMPEMDGMTMYRELKTMQPDLKIIFMSGYAEESIRTSLAEGDDFYFLAKPVGLKDLLTTVKRAIAA